MSDVTAAGPAPAAAAPTGGFQFPSLNALGTMLKRGDIALAVGVHRTVHPNPAPSAPHSPKTARDRRDTADPRY